MLIGLEMLRQFFLGVGAAAGLDRGGSFGGF
jgi:hypothetical protein